MSASQACCCWKNLSACIFIAIAFGFSRIVTAVLTFWYFHESLTVGGFISIEVLCGVAFILDILLLIGTFKKLKILLLIWILLAAGFGIAINIILALVARETTTTAISIILTLLTFLAIGLIIGGMQEIDEFRREIVVLYQANNIVELQPPAQGMFVNRYGMTQADSDEDLIAKHLL